MIFKKVAALADNRFAYAVFLPLLSFVAALHKMVYQTTDDQSMRLILEGAAFSPKEPSEYVIFINILSSRLLKFLYSSFDGVYWYDLFLYLLLFIGSCAVASCAFVKNERKLLKALITAFLFISFRLAFNQAQFTVVSGILACGGVLLLTRAVFAPLSGKEIAAHMICIPVLLFLSAQLRLDMMLLSLLTGGILSLVLLKNVRISAKNAALGFAVLIALAASFKAEAFHKAEYAALPLPFDPLAYNAAKSEILDKAIFNESGIRYEPFVQKALPLLKANGWTRNDLMLFLNWGFTATDFFDYANVKKIAANVAPVLQGEWYQRIALFFKDLPVGGRYMHFLILLLLLFTGQKETRKKILCAHALFLSVFLAFSPFFKPFPLRVYFSLNLLEFIFLTRLLKNDFGFDKAEQNLSTIIEKLRKYVPRRFLPADCAGLAVLLTFYSVLSFYPKYASDVKTAYRSYDRLSVPDEADVRYVLSYALFRGSALPFRPVKPDLSRALLGPGWTVITPSFQKQIGGDFYRKVAEGKIRYLDIFSPSPFEQTERFLKTHYGKACDMNYLKRRRGKAETISSTIECR